MRMDTRNSTILTSYGCIRSVQHPKSKPVPRLGTPTFDENPSYLLSVSFARSRNRIHMVRNREAG